MARITAEAHIDAPKDLVWDNLSDFGGVWRFSPTVVTSHSTTEANSGVGAERHCDLTFAGATVDERIVEWSDSAYTIEILGGEKLPPIKNVIARLEVDSDSGVTVARGTLTYERDGLMGLVMGPMVRRKFGRAWQGIFAGLKHYSETGQIVERGVHLPYEDIVLAAA